MNTLETMRLADEYAKASVAAALQVSGTLRFEREKTRQVLLAHVQNARTQQLAVTDEQILALWRIMDAADNYCAFNSANTRHELRSVILAELEAAARGVTVPDEAQRLNVLASFAHSILMGAIKPKELTAKAREALERTGLLSLDDVVALGVPEVDHG